MLETMIVGDVYILLGSLYDASRQSLVYVHGAATYFAFVTMY
jgi:hypothetical protein